MRGRRIPGWERWVPIAVSFRSSRTEAPNRGPTRYPETQFLFLTSAVFATRAPSGEHLQEAGDSASPRETVRPAIRLTAFPYPNPHPPVFQYLGDHGFGRRAVRQKGTRSRNVGRPAKRGEGLVKRAQGIGTEWALLSNLRERDFTGLISQFGANVRIADYPERAAEPVHTTTYLRVSMAQGRQETNSAVLINWFAVAPASFTASWHRAKLATLSSERLP